MTKKETQYVLNVLNRIKFPDEHVNKAIAYINKDLANFAAMKGQLKEQYEYDDRHW